jgi:hypothetical protein
MLHHGIIESGIATFPGQRSDAEMRENRDESIFTTGNL